MTDPPKAANEPLWPCRCNATLIGLSDRDSVWGWRCSQCGHEWPRFLTARGLKKFLETAGD